MKSLSRKSRNALILFFLPVAVFVAATVFCLKPVTKSFDSIVAESQSLRVTDRNGVPLSISYQTKWNTHDYKPLYDMPEFLVTSFLFSEDRKFYDHGGVDWSARGAALYQNIRHRSTVRGASTITEQVVRMVNPRPRNLWSKWLEGIEAISLEHHANKATILEFYLNQLPYASNRRGIVQASRYYFNRDPETLSTREMLALTILARAPSSYDLYKAPDKIEKPLERLATQMKVQGKISDVLYQDIALQSLDTIKPTLPVEARHFARYARLNGPEGTLATTLDASLQSQVQDILDTRLKKLKPKNANNAGAIVIDHETGNILAWVSAGARDPKTKGGEIDPVLTPRQPGSTLKPFLYAGAIEKGWTAATILKDAPIAEAVGSGLHRFRNYSGTHYGPITVREALGNSLNIPAVLTIDYVGVESFLTTLHQLGFENLTKGSDFYDEGLALGNGEVSLLELTRAYAALANHGEYAPPKFLMSENARSKNKIYSAETASLIGNILSDPRARALEFGRDSILNLPVRTAIKTGTSTDYRDAWTIGYNDRYTVGIWMGNLDRTPMKEVTGSTGPALALRSIFHRLNQNRETKPLYLSPALIEKEICTRPVKDGEDCPTRPEYFLAGATAPDLPAAASKKIELVRPTKGLMMAYDPRIPESHQKFRFELANLPEMAEVEWILNGKTLDRGPAPTYLWPIEKGLHTLSVKIHTAHGAQDFDPIPFTVR